MKTRLLLAAGISMEGDDILLAEMDVKVAPKREEWMTTLPPERKVRIVSMFFPPIPLLFRLENYALQRLPVYMSHNHCPFWFSIWD